MTTMSILVMICICVLGFYKLEALGALMGSLEFCSPDCGLVIMFLSFFCLMQLLRYMLLMRKCSMTFSWKMKVDLICIKVYSIHGLYFVHVLEAFYTLN